MTGELSRRQLLTVGGVALFTGLAGCSGNGDDESTTAGAGQDDDSGLGEPDQSDSDSSPDETGQAGDDSSADETGQREDDDGGDDRTVESTAVLSDVTNWEPSYAVDIEYLEGEAEELTQTVHEGDSHIVVDIGGMRAEAFRVDGESYEVVEGQCFIRPNPEAEDQVPEVDDPSTDAPDIESSETTTVDGESVYVFEMPSEEEATWYVSTETGYPVRFEAPVYIATFHSWGETDPISAPDMNCQEI